MRSRYFKEAVARKPGFAWVGDPIITPSLSQETKEVSRHLHYRAFQLGNLEAEVGDFILIKNDSESESLLDCDVARLDRIYHNYENSKDPYRAIVTWLCRPSMMPGQLSPNGEPSHGLEEQGVPPLSNDFEVTGEARAFVKDISAESIYYKCIVIKEGLWVKPDTYKSKQRKATFPTYMWRFDMTVSKGKKDYLLEPLDKSSEYNKTSRSDKMPLGENNVNKPPLTDVKLINIKRKLSTGDSLESPAKRVRSKSGGSSRSVDKDPSPELNSFVTGTPGEAAGLDGGYWGSPSVGKRTPKPSRRASMSAPSTPVRSLLSDSRFTKVETETGSGRKVTIKCGVADDKKKFAPSSGLAAGQISSILDSDDDEKPLVKKESVPKARVRRASVSCTTPTRMRITTVTSVTPIKEKPKSRPVSEAKKRPSFEDDSDDEFVPSKVKASLSKSASKVNSSKKRLSLSVDNKDAASDTESSSSEEDSDSDLEVASKPSRRASKSVPKSKNNMKTPNKAKKSEFKPCVTPRAKPVKPSCDPMAEAQQRLHVSAVPDSLPCREEEFAEIFGYVESKLREGVGGCYYISGVPGTGKTATVMEVMRYLEESKEDYPDFNFYQINGMRLTSPEQAYVEIWRLLTGEKATPEHSLQLLDTRFSRPAPKRGMTVLLVDELDMLCNRKQSVLYNLFSWPSQAPAKLVLLCIANTMDLPERVMVNRVASRLGLTRLTFQPYTHTQLQAIVASRLDGLQVFQQDAIQLVARKVASLSGDARRALDICRRATELAEVGGSAKIGVGHVSKAHQEMFTSPKILAIRSCSEYEQLLLRVMVQEFHRTGVEETVLGAVHRELTTLLRTERLPTLSLEGLACMVARLSGGRLLLAEHLRAGLDTKLRLNVAAEDINFALKKVEAED